MNDSRLAAMVQLHNDVNAYAMRLYETMAPFFAAHVGKNIQREALDDLFWAIKNEVPSTPELPTDFESSMVITQDSVSWTIYGLARYAWTGGLSLAVETTRTIAIGRLVDRRLESIFESPSLRSDYTVEEIENKRVECQRIREEYYRTLRELEPFGP